MDENRTGLVAIRRRLYWEAATVDAGIAAREADACLSAVSNGDRSAPVLLDRALCYLRAATNSARFALAAVNDGQREERAGGLRQP